MKTFFTNRFFIFTMSTILGASSMWVYDHYINSTSGDAKKIESKTLSDKSENIFDDFFAQKYDPFEDMRRMQKKIFEQFDRESAWNKVFSHNKNNFTNEIKSTQITRREDKDNIYFDVDLDGQKANEFNVNVKNGQINISGKVEQKQENAESRSVFQSRFQQSFPAPPDVDADKFKVTEENQKIVIILPKLHGV